MASNKKDALIEEMEKALESSRENEDRLHKRLARLVAAPANMQEFEVLMRVSDGERNWCLIIRGEV